MSKFESKMLPKQQVNHFYRITICPPEESTTMSTAMREFRLCTSAPLTTVVPVVKSLVKSNYKVIIYYAGEAEWFINKYHNIEYKGVVPIQGELDTLETLCAELPRLRFVKVTEVEEEKVIVVKREVREEV